MSYQLIGKITGFKGLKGEMKVKPLSGFMLERLTKDATIYIKMNESYEPFTVQSYHENQKYPLLILKGYHALDLVEKFKHKDIFVESDARLDLPEDTYHQDELIGLKVFQKNIYKGQVIDIKNYPSDDYLVVETEGKHVMIPFRDEFIETMDDESIEVVDMEGLF
jgi:16S rRNA processing protein RimM